MFNLINNFIIITEVIEHKEDDVIISNPVSLYSDIKFDIQNNGKCSTCFIDTLTIISSKENQALFNQFFNLNKTKGDVYKNERIWFKKIFSSFKKMFS